MGKFAQFYLSNEEDKDNEKDLVQTPVKEGSRGSSFSSYYKISRDDFAPQEQLIQEEKPSEEAEKGLLEKGKEFISRTFQKGKELFTKENISKVGQDIKESAGDFGEKIKLDIKKIRADSDPLYIAPLEKRRMEIEEQIVRQGNDKNNTPLYWDKYKNLTEEHKKLTELINDQSPNAQFRRMREVMDLDQSKNIHSFRAGFIEGVKGFVDFVTWKTQDTPAVSNKSQEISKKMEAWAAQERATDPTFVDNVVEGLGSAALYFIPGLGAAKGTTLLAKFSPRVAMLVGGSVSALLESGSEAGNVYQENIDQGKKVEEADKNATTTFWANALLTSVLNRTGLFSGNKKIIAKLISSTSSEGLQEFNQQVISNINTGREWDEGAIESGLIGSIIGGSLSGFDVETGKPVQKTAGEIQTENRNKTEEGRLIQEVEEIANAGIDETNVIRLKEIQQALPDNQKAQVNFLIKMYEDKVATPTATETAPSIETGAEDVTLYRGTNPDRAKSGVDFEQGVTFYATDRAVAEDYAGAQQDDRITALKEEKANLIEEISQEEVKDADTKKARILKINGEIQAIQKEINKNPELKQVAKAKGVVTEIKNPLKNPLVIDAQGQTFDAVNKSAIEQARAEGRDGVVIKNVIDAIGQKSNKPTTTFLVFNDQVKTEVETKPTQEEAPSTDKTKQEQPKPTQKDVVSENIAKVKEVYKSKEDAVYQAMGEIFAEMEVAEAGQRLFVEQPDTMDQKVIGIKSSFPSWIPEDLRSKKLFDKVLGGIVSIDDLKYPEANKTAQRALYDAILDEVDSRAGVDTSEYRNAIIEAYATNEKAKAKKTVRSGSQGSEALAESADDKGVFAEVGKQEPSKELKVEDLFNKDIIPSIKPLQFPEILKMAKEIMGKTPEVKAKLSGALGRFYSGKGEIKLRADIFKDPYQASRVFAHELGHAIDWMPDADLKRGNLLGRIATLHKHLKGMLGDLSNKTVRKELMDLSALWRPLGEEGWTAYRKNAKELYADAISVLLNDPALLQEKAPEFYKGFFEYLDQKPEVYENFFALQDLLNQGEEAVLEGREKDIREMFKKGEDLFKVKLAERQKKDNDFAFRLKFELIDQNQKVIDLVNKAQKEGRLISDDANPVYWLEGSNYIGGVVKNFIETNIQPVYEKLNKAEVTWEDFGEVLFLERVVNERGELANPLGYDKQSATKQLKFLEESLGADKWKVLQEELGKYREAIKSVLDDAKKSGLYSEEIVEELKANPSYATYQVLDYLDVNIPSSIKHQVGTLKEISNPATATIVKTISMIRASERNMVKHKLVGFLQEKFREEIEDAKTVWNGKTYLPIESKEVDKALLTLMENGKFTGYYVDPYIAKTVEYNSAGQNSAVISVLKFFNGKLFRPLFITFNLGFQSFNTVRDFMRFYKNVPNMTLFRAVKRYKQALPAAIARAWELPNATIQEMEKSKILGVTYNDIIKGLTEEEQQIDYVIAKAGLSPLKQRKVNTFVRPFMTILDTIEKTGNFIETLPKVAGYLELNGKMPNQELASFIRTSVGSPDFLRRGAGYRWYNEVFLFSNAIKEGMRSDFNIATSPKTRAGFWVKTVQTTFLPKLLMYAILAGLLGDDAKKMMEDVSEYDKTNYLIVPLGKQGNKTIYLRIPQDETSRLLGGLLWKAVRATGNEQGFIKDLTDILSFTGGQIPSVTPVVELVGGTIQFASGQNPYDYFRGRNVIPDDAFKAGGKYALKPFITWQLENLGAGSIMKFYVTEKAPETKTWGQKVLDAPLLSNTLGRWIKYSSYGQLEENRKILKEIESGKSAERIEENRLVNDYVGRYQKENTTSIFRKRELERELVTKVLGEPPYNSDQKTDARRIAKKYNISILRGESDPNINSLIEAQDNDSKAIILREIKEDMTDAQFEAFRKQMLENKVISEDVLKKYKRL